MLPRKRQAIETFFPWRCLTIDWDAGLKSAKIFVILQDPLGEIRNSISNTRTMSVYHFRPLTCADLPMVARWLGTPEVLRWLG
jgi:hypothetical protein